MTNKILLFKKFIFLIVKMGILSAWTVDFKQSFYESSPMKSLVEAVLADPFDELLPWPHLKIPQWRVDCLVNLCLAESCRPLVDFFVDGEVQLLPDNNKKH